MCASLLRTFCYVVIEAESADAAAAVLHSNVIIDLVLTDLQMPGTIDGLGLAHVVRSAHPRTGIVMTSGHLEAGGATNETTSLVVYVIMARDACIPDVKQGNPFDRLIC